MERAKGGESATSVFFLELLMPTIFVFVSKDVWAWNLHITCFLQSGYLCNKRGQIHKKPSHDRQSSFPWTIEDDV